VPKPADELKPRLVELPRTECLTLLAAASVGRVVVAGHPGQPPVIRPVSYLFDARSQAIVFRTSEGSKFDALVRSTQACFEIDAVDPHTHTGWSVIVSGVTEEVTRPAEIRRLEDAGLHTWAPGERPHWIRIQARTVSGRRIEVNRSA
jgi:nitroimidazol reductase NimA-like FMN-containing flavoprotein (pyridoxamine 5'-phosphate oxidase superfamily)